jgi:hypothetical protein
MAIIEGPITLVGESGVKPVVKRMVVTDDLATITTAGYLNTNLIDGADNLQTSDLLLIMYNYDTVQNTGDKDFFNVGISNGIITLTADISGGNVVLPTVAGNVAEFTNTDGKIGDSGVVAARVLQADFDAPDFNANTVFGTIDITAADLAVGQTVTVIPSAGAQQYAIVDLNISSLSTDFSGGGGDREIVLTDDSADYTILAAATLGSIPDARWGSYDGTSVKLPFPSTSGMSRPTDAGSSLRAQYLSGTADYTTGSLRLSYLAVRIA